MQPKMKESVSLKLFLGLRNVIEVRRTRPSRKLENDRANLEAGNLKPEI
jgi:HAMP domain-containing protein